MSQRLAGLLLFLAVVPVVACGTFVQTDSTFRPHRRRTYPKVFLDRLPERLYRSVGVIEVGGGDLADVVRNAREKGLEVGCDVIVSADIHRISRGIPGAHTWLAAGYGNHSNTGVAQPQPLIVNPGPSHPGERFICGVYSKENVDEDPK